MEYEFSKGNVIIYAGASELSLPDTLDCGQAFRWSREEDGVWSGYAGSNFLRLAAVGDTVVLFDTPEERFEGFWKSYFDLDRDYGAIRTELCRDDTLAEAVRYAPGVRVLNQDGWEALCTFIVTSNNNVARIKGIVSRLCEGWGEPAEGGFAFPTAERLAALAPEDLAPLRCGYRAEYLADCSQKVASGELELDPLRTMPLEEARKQLCMVKGVGPKVADCALLFGFGRTECFPRDVWIKRAMEELFPEGLPECAAPFAGIAQQYIFHYMRTGRKKAGAG